MATEMEMLVLAELGFRGTEAKLQSGRDHRQQVARKKHKKLWSG